MDCTKEPCCNTCKHSRVQYSSPYRKCAIDKDPYANYFGGHNPETLHGTLDFVPEFSEKYGISYHLAYEASNGVQPKANFWREKDFSENEILANLKQMLKAKIDKQEQKLAETKRQYSEICWRATK